jgi:uncharacterized membrane protein
MGIDTSDGISPSAASGTGIQSGRRTVSAVASYSFSGPLPPPELLAKYNDVIPNGAERIMAMAEEQAHHRQALEKIVVGGNVQSETRGQWMGLVICLVVVLGGILLIHEGRQLVGGGIVGADLVALVGVFVYGKKVQRQELQSKNQQFKRK